MKPFEQALLNDCASKCAFEMYKTLRRFKDNTYADKILIKEALNLAIKENLNTLEKQTEVRK